VVVVLLLLLLLPLLPLLDARRVHVLVDA